MIKKVEAAYDHILDFGVYVACFLIGGTMLLICTDVTLRYTFSRPIAPTIELSELSLLLVAVFTVAWLLREDGHVRVDILLSHLKPRPKALANAITFALSTIALLILCWYGLQMILYTLPRGTEVWGSSLDIPLVVHLIPLAIGLFLFAIEFGRGSYKYLKGLRQTKVIDKT